MNKNDSDESKFFLLEVCHANECHVLIHIQEYISIIYLDESMKIIINLLNKPLLISIGTHFNAYQLINDT